VVNNSHLHRGVRAIGLILLLVFAAHFAVSWGLQRLPRLNFWLEGIIEATFITVLTTVLVWRLLVAHARQRGQDELARLNSANRTLRLISDCNQVLVRATSEQDLLDDLCRLVVERGGYRFAWVGMAETDPDRTVRPVAQCGTDLGYLGATRITWDESEYGRGPVGRTLRTGRPHAIKDIAHHPDFAPWRDVAHSRGFASCIALPLTGRGRTFGVLALYSAQPDVFDDKEIELLMELAGDLAFGLTTLRDSAEHAKAREQLVLLDAAVTAAPNSIVITDAQGRIEWVNPAFTATTGYSLAEAVGQNPRLLKSGRQPDAYYAGLWRTILAGHNWHGEFINKRKDGTFYTEDVTIAPIRDSTGVIRHFVAVKFDISLRRAAEEKNRELVEYIDKSQAAVMVVDLDDRVSFWNEGAMRLFGYSAGEVMGRKPEETFGRNALEAISNLRRSVAQNGAWTGEIQFHNKAGQPVEAANSTTFIRDAAGQPKGRLNILTDIRERKEAERKIRTQAELLNKARDAVMVADLQNRITFWNHSSELLTGYASAEVLGQSIEDIMGHHLRAQAEAARRSVLETGAWQSELTLVRKDGAERIIDLHLTLIRDDSGRPVSRLGIATDITEKKKLEEQFLRAQRLENLGMLAAGIAHDLNNVLAPVLMAAPLLRLSATKPSDLRMLTAIEKSVERGSALVRQILSFAHGSGNTRTLVQIKHLLRDVTTLVRESFPKAILLEEEIPNDLWTVKGNPTQLHQVLLNLCVNARDAMPQGGTLRLRAENRRLDAAAAASLPEAQPGSYLMLEVTDSGTGIPPDVLAHIWEPFFTTKGEGKGTGLGLSTVRGITLSHGGFVGVESKLGSGTTFRIFLPAAEIPAGGEAADKSMHPFAPQGQNELVLVVEDEVNIRELVNTHLTAQGYQVLLAADGIDAIARFAPRTGDIALVVTDISMPEMNGLDLAHVLNLMNPGVKIMFMSGNDAPNIAGPLPAGARLLKKPFSAIELVKSVHGALADPPAAH
jgi:PAS domain S-box-containing protein